MVGLEKRALCIFKSFSRDEESLMQTALLTHVESADQGTHHRAEAKGRELVQPELCGEVG